MKILIYSPLFYPSVGGLETVVSILAHEFVEQGHTVKLVSNVLTTDRKVFAFEVIRKPNPLTLLNLTQWCDVYFQPVISLKGIWTLLISPKPWVVAHHNWYTRPNGSLGWQDHLKKFLLRFATNISVSQALANHISTPSVIIPNPYRDEIFYEIPKIPRNKDLVFLGRLVSDKGVDLLIQSLAELKQMGLSPKLTIIGSGLEESNLREQARVLTISEQIEFVGLKVEQELIELLNTYKIMVIPSRWQEPFGIVALEGIACGCVIVGSEGGGLKDAIGPCGVTFPNGDVQALTQTLFNLLKNPEQLANYRANSDNHLLRHQKSVVAKAYLEVIEAVIR
ncbi:MAG: glycosyltransferase family 4 protein [Nostoc sp.]|uniref:glycosyltransferase family 4 protein n=1 Tax=unclassified Nostoc TaxID=2593658 RepID=UPI0025E392DD|nr:glycosyltransferase family 4 protein [Nostoc sp. JL33]MBN3870650.1 glycosyltransferase family 4 protein [Nostoc sp. JL33]